MRLYFPFTLFLYTMGYMRFALIIAVATILTGCAHISGPSLTLPSPALLPDISAEMLSSGYWISRHPSPHKIVMTKEEIAILNENLRQIPNYTRDISSHSDHVDGEELSSILLQTITDFSKQSFFTLEGIPVKSREYQSLLHKSAIKNIPSDISVSFAIATTRSSFRMFPESQGLYKTRKSDAFDRAQVSGVDPGTPLAVLHRSSDGLWCYVRGPSCDGWVPQEFIAFCSKKELQNFLFSPRFAVVIAAKGDFFYDREYTQWITSVRMGGKFPLLAHTDKYVEIAFPERDKEGFLLLQKAYIVPEEISEGYLPFTPQKAISQAFKLLHAPYDWGDKYGGQDCSRFIQQLFATFGIFLPRNSAQQGKVGIPLTKFNPSGSNEEKLNALSSAIGGITLLQMPGHIMLYLGIEKNQGYVIHSLWAYKEKIEKLSATMVVNRITVSHLNLGENGSSGSFLKRVLSARTLSLQ